MTVLSRILGSPRPLVGVVHLPPLPGSPRYGGDLGKVVRRAVKDCAALSEAGFDGLVLENFGDAPFLPGPVEPATVAAMTAIAVRVADATDLPFGVNVLRNDARAALAVALAAGGRFLRVNVHTGVTATDQGVIEGRAHETLRDRARLGADVAILADVLVKHGTPLSPADPAGATQDALRRGLADALLVTGDATGAPVDPDLLTAVREAAGGAPVLIASGLTPRNAARLVPLADGALVGTAVKRGGVAGGPVDRARARRLARAFRKAVPA